MALFHGNFYSTVLFQNEDINVILPLPDADDQLNGMGAVFDSRERFPVLYLLHGAFGDYSDWVRNTNIEKYAQKHRIAVVMASAGNSFYLDMAHGQKYGTFFSTELPNLVKGLFPVSDKREKTFITGASMGGYGAFRLALMYPQTYGAAASLSGALDVNDIYDIWISQRATNVQDIFGERAGIGSGNMDLYALAEKRLGEGVELPMLFQSCGKEDFLYDGNRNMHSRFEELGLSLQYEEHPGTHDWIYWDQHIRRALEWFCARSDV